ncbi:hypothetical protein MKW92_033710 [Papaver armeniacum]|nr:hypothetical protein MKW92_033710 [Papaver armeniacum]
MENPDVCTHQNDHIDVWMMMDNKWSKHLKITAHMTDMCYSRSIQTLQNGEILIEGGPMMEEGLHLISYDPKLERVRALKIHGFPIFSDVDTYIETLVPLKSGTYVKKKKERKQKLRSITTNKKVMGQCIRGEDDMVERYGVGSFIFLR